MLQNGRRPLHGRHVSDAADQNTELAWQILAKLLNGGSLLLGADHAGDGPGALQQQWGEELGDLAVAADEENAG